MGGFFVRYTHVPGISFRLGINYGSLYATDQWNQEKALKAKTVADDAYQRYVRNLDIKSNIWESNLLMEFAPLRISNWEFGKLAQMKFQPYLLLGISGFYFNPRGTFKDFETGRETEVELKPLHTEGQNFSAPGSTFPKNYSNFSFAAVGGIGFKFDIGKGLELRPGISAALYSLHDHLDDVSGKYTDPLNFDIAYQNQPGKANLCYADGRPFRRDHSGLSASGRGIPWRS